MSFSTTTTEKLNHYHTAVRISFSQSSHNSQDQTSKSFFEISFCNILLSLHQISYFHTTKTMTIFTLSDVCSFAKSPSMKESIWNNSTKRGREQQSLGCPWPYSAAAIGDLPNYNMASATSNQMTSPVLSSPATTSSNWDSIIEILDSADTVVSSNSTFCDMEPTPLGPQGVSLLTPSTISPELDRFSVECLQSIFNTSILELQPPAAKRSRVDGARTPSKPDATPSSSSFATDDKERFRPYQFDQWHERYEELVKFQEEHGHCLVPHFYPTNQQLAQWVKRQRYQYKLKGTGRHSTLTEERLLKLESLGFIWHSHNLAWYERLQSLKGFKAKHGHCCVPSNYVDKALAIWVKGQRRQYKVYQKGMSKSTMTMERFQQLNSLGFDWNPRNL